MQWYVTIQAAMFNDPLYDWIRQRVDPSRMSHTIGSQIGQYASTRQHTYVRFIRRPTHKWPVRASSVG